MQISVMNKYEQFDELKKDWDAVYSADHFATIFVSWEWLRGWSKIRPYQWLILAARPDAVSPYVAFMALAVDNPKQDGSYNVRNLYMGGNPNSDHTGFVCLNGYDDEAIPAFSEYVQNQLKWDKFYIRDVFDPRIDIFLSCLSKKKFYVSKADSTSCPYIALPDNWDLYLQDFLKTKTRHSILRNIRRLERNTDFCVTQVEADNLEVQVETFIKLFQLRWGPQPEHDLNRYRSILRYCFENDSLWLDIFWDGTTPIAAMAGFIDKKMKTFSNYNGGYDIQFEKLSPGKAMVAHSIKFAINNGYQTYDFLRGDEDYKFSFGAKKRYNKNITIRRENMKMTFHRSVLKLNRSLKKIFIN